MRPTRPTLSSGVIDLELWLVDLAGLSPLLEREEQAVPRLSDAEKARSAAITSEADGRRHWRAAHIALRILIERLAGPALRGQPFAIGLGGRPGLEGNPVSFSLSHTGGMALIALSRHGPVGADIERRRPIRISDGRRQAIVAHAQSLAPHAPLPALPEARFLQSWVRLEAVAKASGRGIGKTLTDAGVSSAPPPRDQSPRTRPDFEVSDVHAGTGLFAAVAAPELPDICAITGFPSEEIALKVLLRTTA